MHQLVCLSCVQFVVLLLQQEKVHKRIHTIINCPHEPLKSACSCLIAGGTAQHQSSHWWGNGCRCKVSPLCGWRSVKQRKEGKDRQCRRRSDKAANTLTLPLGCVSWRSRVMGVIISKDRSRPLASPARNWSEQTHQLLPLLKHVSHHKQYSITIMITNVS